jgi:hypothetical protein
MEEKGKNGRERENYIVAFLFCRLFNDILSNTEVIILECSNRGVMEVWLLFSVSRHYSYITLEKL